MPTRSASRQASAPELAAYPVSSNSVLGWSSLPSHRRELTQQVASLLQEQVDVLHAGPHG